MLYRFRRTSIFCLLVFAAGAVYAQGQPPAASPPSSQPIAAQPLYEQCQSLVDNSEAAAGALPLLKDKDPLKRVKATEALAKFCDSRATAPLLSAAKDDEVINVRVAAVAALGQLGDREAIDPLIETIEGADWRVRLALVRTLASFQVYKSNNAVLNALTNPGDKKVTEEGDLRVRLAGILTVNQLRDVRFSRKAIGFLFTFQDHENPAFRRLVETAALELRNTRNGYHELAAILKQHNYPDFRRKSAYWLGQFTTDQARAALEDAAANDRDPGVKKAAQEALAGMKRQ